MGKVGFLWKLRSNLHIPQNAVGRRLIVTQTQRQLLPQIIAHCGRVHMSVMPLYAYVLLLLRLEPIQRYAWVASASLQQFLQITSYFPLHPCFLSVGAEDEQRDALQAAGVLGRPARRARPVEERRRRRRGRPLRRRRRRQGQDQGGGQGRQAQGEQVLQGQCEQMPNYKSRNLRVPFRLSIE